MKFLSAAKMFLLVLAGGLYSCASSQYAQTSEYDDMYYGSKDRNVAVAATQSYPTSTTATKRAITVPEDDDSGIGVGYHSKTLNPDYNTEADAPGEAVYADDAYVDDAYSADDYYVENYSREDIEGIVDDYISDSYPQTRRFDRGYPRTSYYRSFDNVFWSDPFFYEGTIFDPLYRSYYDFYSPYGYSRYNSYAYGGYSPYNRYRSGYRSGFSFGLSFGFGYGGYGRGYGRYYDPFYSSFYGYNAWCPPSYYGRSNNVVIVNNIESGNSGYNYGLRSSRSGATRESGSVRERPNSVNGSAPQERRIRSQADQSNSTSRTRSTIDGTTINRANSTGSRTIRGTSSDNTINRSSSNARSIRTERAQRSNEINQRSNSSNIDRSAQQRSSQIRTRSTQTQNNNIRSGSTVPANRRSYTPSRSTGQSNRSSGSSIRSNSSRSSTPSRSNYSSGSRSSSPSRSSSSYSGGSRSSSPSPRISSGSRSTSTPSRSSSSSRRDH